jgi:hypothetical protein
MPDREEEEGGFLCTKKKQNMNPNLYVAMQGGKKETDDDHGRRADALRVLVPSDGVLL